MVSIGSALNRAYDIEESRPWWKVRLTAIALTVGVALFILGSFTLVVAGPQLAELMANRGGLGPEFEWTWKILQWPFIFALVVVGFGLIYYFAPDAEQEWVWITPGAVLGATLWLLASLAFRLYVVNFGNYGEAYGTLGAIILLMLWFYITGLAIIVGAEMAAEIEHASPWGQGPGEKIPGRKKKIGAAASRAFRQRQHHATSPPPGAPVAMPPGYRPQPRSRASTLLRIAASWRRCSRCSGASGDRPSDPSQLSDLTRHSVASSPRDARIAVRNSCSEFSTLLRPIRRAMGSISQPSNGGNRRLSPSVSISM